jgi:hypothetical protein
MYFRQEVAMGKIKILRSDEARIAEPVIDMQNIRPSKYQIDIPGMGRLRTGERHLNFHAIRTEPVKPDINRPEESEAKSPVKQLSGIK